MPVRTDASFVDKMVPNVAIQFHDRVASSPTAEAFRYPLGDSWESVTWQEAGDHVADTHLGKGSELLGCGRRPVRGHVPPRGAQPPAIPESRPGGLRNQVDPCSLAGSSFRRL